jgi:predicted ester cyclase
MTVEENKHAVTRVFNEAFNAGNLGVIDEVTAASSVDHQHPNEPSFAEHLKSVVTAMRTAFPDLHFEINTMIGEGEWVALRCVMTGTHNGPLRRPLLPADGPPVIPPTGKAIAVPHMHMIRFQDGKQTELWHLMDSLALLSQLGLFPPPGGRSPS